MKTVSRIEIIISRGDWTYTLSSETEDDDLPSHDEIADELSSLAASAANYLRSSS